MLNGLGKAGDDAFTGLKIAISAAPVLRFFDSKEPVTLSVDASSQGLGGVILQNDRPVDYASNALTLSQQNYGKSKRRCYCIRLRTLPRLFVRAP